MLNPTTLLSAIVATYNTIPEFTAAMTTTGPANIASYLDLYPASCNRARALQDLKSPGALFFYDGTDGENTDERGMYNHQFSVAIRSKETASGSTETYPAIGAMLVNGVPSSGTLRVSRMQFVAGVEPLVFRAYQPRIDLNGLEYFEFRFDLPEIGDN